MDNKLLLFVTSERLNGTPDREIKEKLLKVGWKVEIIEKALYPEDIPVQIEQKVLTFIPRKRYNTKLILFGSAAAVLVITGVLYFFLSNKVAKTPENASVSTSVENNRK